MRLGASLSLLFVLACSLFIAFPSPGQWPGEELCDSGFQDCRQLLWNRMNAETVQIDVAFWFMFDHSLDKLAAGGIPMRDYKATDGIQHWKMMLFAGQNVVQFSAANYGGNDFVPRALRY